MPTIALLVSKNEWKEIEGVAASCGIGAVTFCENVIAGGALFSLPAGKEQVFRPAPLIGDAPADAQVLTFTQKNFELIEATGVARGIVAGVWARQIVLHYLELTKGPGGGVVLNALRQAVREKK